MTWALGWVGTRQGNGEEHGSDRTGERQGNDRAGRTVQGRAVIDRVRARVAAGQGATLFSVATEKGRYLSILGRGAGDDKCQLQPMQIATQPRFLHLK